MQVNGRPATAGQLGALALTNYGAFTTFLVEPAGVRGYRLHLRRLVDDTRAVFGVRLDEGRVDHDVRLFLADLARPVTVRVTAFSAALDLAAPERVDEVDLLVTARPAGAGPGRPLRLGSVPFVRELAGVKHTGLSGQVHARRSARLAGHDDALLVDRDGRVSEGPTWNVGFSDGESVVWPDPPGLPGVTMRLLTDALRAAGTPVASRPVRLADLAGFDAAFVTNAAVGVVPVQAVDGHTFDPDTQAVRHVRAVHRRVPHDRV